MLTSDRFIDASPAVRRDVAIVMSDATGGRRGRFTGKVARSIIIG